MGRKNGSRRTSSPLKLWKIRKKSSLDDIFDKLSKNQTTAIDLKIKEDILKMESKPDKSVDCDDTDDIVSCENEEDNVPEKTITNGKRRIKKRHIATDYFKKMDEKISPLLELTDCLSKCVELMNKANSAYKHVNKNIAEANEEVEDLKHEIELIWEDAHGGYVRYDQLKHVLIRRRAYKEIREEIEPVAEFIKNNKEAFDKLSNVSKLIKDRVTLRNSEHKAYVPRIRNDLKVAKAYDNASPERQEYIKKCIELRRCKKIAN